MGSSPSLLPGNKHRVDRAALPKGTRAERRKMLQPTARRGRERPRFVLPPLFGRYAAPSTVRAASPAEQDRLVMAAQAKRERKNAQRLARVGA